MTRKNLLGMYRVDLRIEADWRKRGAERWLARRDAAKVETCEACGRLVGPNCNNGNCTD